jgi:hypothetical protein
MELKLNDFTNKDILSEDDKDRVLGIILSLGSAYPSEISRHLALKIEEVNSALMRLINEGMIKKIIPDPLYPQTLIKCRISDMWAIGCDNYGKFALHSWFGGTLKGLLNYCNFPQ